jgi:hypothetical protein
MKKGFVFVEKTLTNAHVAQQFVLVSSNSKSKMATNTEYKNHLTSS